MTRCRKAHVKKAMDESKARVQEAIDTGEAHVQEGIDGYKAQIVVATAKKNECQLQYKKLQEQNEYLKRILTEKSKEIVRLHEKCQIIIAENKQLKKTNQKVNEVENLFKDIFQVMQKRYAKNKKLKKKIIVFLFYFFFLG